MKISLDNALVWLIPYLYLISVLHYWGFWGTFHLDVFSYYAVSDLIKGVISPISNALAFVIVIGCAIGAVEVLEVWSTGKPNKVKLIVAVLGSIPIAFFLTYGIGHLMQQHPDVDYTAGDLPKTIAPLVAPVVVVFVSSAIYAILLVNGIEPKIWRFVLIYFLVLFPCRVYQNAASEAKRVIQNKEFSYVMANNITKPAKAVYKYLGKVGDYYVLLSEDNVKSIVVPTSALAPLIIETYSQLDTPSMKRFDLNKKALLTLAPTPLPVAK